MSSQRRELKLWPILLATLSVVIVLLAASDFLRAFVGTQVREEGRSKVIEVVSPALIDYQREQADLLDGYEWVDREAGVVRLPIDRAMELVARDAEATR